MTLPGPLNKNYKNRARPRAHGPWAHEPFIWALGPWALYLGVPGPLSSAPLYLPPYIYSQENIGRARTHVNCSSTNVQSWEGHIWHLLEICCTGS